MPQRRRARLIRAATFVSLMSLYGLGSARAETFPESSLDSVIDEADVVLVATIADVRHTPDQSGDWPALTTVELEDVEVIAADVGVPPRIMVNAEPFDGQTRPLRYEPALVLGQRYVLFLRTGPWKSGPFLTQTVSIRPVRDDGVVLCLGGEVYGLAPDGLVCSTAAPA